MLQEGKLKNQAWVICLEIGAYVLHWLWLQPHIEGIVKRSRAEHTGIIYGSENLGRCQLYLEDSYVVILPEYVCTIC